MAEIAVYSFLSLLAAGLLVTLLRETRRFFGQSTASFLVDRAFDKALGTLRQDLEETSLSSIRVYPGPPETPAAKELPGLTLAGAAGELTGEGIPRWSRHVFYTLKNDGASGSLTGSLVRWEKPMESAGGLPAFTPQLPTQALAGSRLETVLRDVQLPNTTVPEVSASAIGPVGGFAPSFVRYSAGKEQLSAWNPGEASLGLGGLTMQGNTALVDLELRVWKAADSVSASQYAVVRFRVCPRTRS